MVEEKKENTECATINISKAKIWIGIISACMGILTPIIVVANSVYKQTLLESRVTILEAKLEEYINKQDVSNTEVLTALGKINTNIEWIIKAIK